MLMDGHYPERFQETVGPYRPETVDAIHRWCRVGRMSMQAAIDFIELLEDDRRTTTAEAQFDEVFGGYTNDVVPAGFPVQQEIPFSTADAIRVDL